MQLVLATALAIVSSASAASCTSAQLSTMSDLLAANVTAACASSLNMNTTIASAMSDPFGLCQPGCATDLSNLTSGLPACDETASIAAGIAQVSQMCTSLANPTMNGGTCTSGDMMTYMGVLKAPVWTNCSTAVNATLTSIAPSSPMAVQTLCASATCAAFLSAMEKKMPNCSMAGETPGQSVNMKSTFQMMFGCTRATAGAPCSLIDLGSVMAAAMTPVWANCSTFLKLPQGATIKEVMPDENTTTTTLPTGFCTSTCPQYVLSVMKSLPSCTMDGKNISDATELYKLCPNVKPNHASTNSVFMWSYVVLLLTAVATHL